MKKAFVRKRPEFPKRAVITSGMPYGNKALHFGHVGGLFVHADTFTRFLKDRIGNDKVIFVSGTDCYGSPIIANYDKFKETNPDKSLEDFVMGNHIMQKDVLEKFEIIPSLYAASAFGDAAEIHKDVSNKVFNKLYETGQLKKMSTPQFFDKSNNMYLNGRQVLGKCPFEGCKSEKAYADECDLGHQYMPSELIEPKSSITGESPELVNVENWYFALEDYSELLKEMIQKQKMDKEVRKYIINTIEEFLKNPIIYIKRNDFDELGDLVNSLPKHELIDEPKKPSVSFVFDNLDDRDLARAIFDKESIRYRTGKTLVPFRLSGNVQWGVPVPEKDGVKDLTFWVWPESLWAPISFTKAYLKSQSLKNDKWQDWWLSDESKVYQFIGQDNIYFYGIAEMAMAMALQGVETGESLEGKNVNLPQIVANNHILFLDKKAGSSSEVKPPLAHELLDHYTSDQLRMHFLSLGLAKKSVSFSPQVYDTNSDPKEQDPVLKDGNLLTNVYNRLIRSCFYTMQTHFDSKLPVGEISQEILDLSEKCILDYERDMHRKEFHTVIFAMDSYIRKLSKYWSKHMTAADKNDDNELREKILRDCFHGVRVAMTLLHPITPSSCEGIREYLNLDEKVWSWEFIFDSIFTFMDDSENHEFKNLPPRTDFYVRHESQFKAK